MPVLTVEGLTCRYGKVAAVRELSIEVREGELVSLIGANGAGKTTTLKAISGVLPPAAGRITFQGEDITRASAQADAAARHRPLPGGAPRLPLHDGGREPGDGLLSARRRRRHRRATWRGCSSAFPILHERRHQAAGTLSGGEQQMLAISRALMCRPKLVLFDEPSLGLAPNLVERTFDIIKEIRGQGVTVVMVEQNAFAALELSDRSYVLEQGRRHAHRHRRRAARQSARQERLSGRLMHPPPLCALPPPAAKAAGIRCE